LLEIKLKCDIKKNILQIKISLVTSLRDVIITKICCFCFEEKNKNQWRHYETSEE